MNRFLSFLRAASNIGSIKQRDVGSETQRLESTQRFVLRRDEKVIQLPLNFRGNEIENEIQIGKQRQK
jgi:hypothetical protein